MLRRRALTAAFLVRLGQVAGIVGRLVYAGLYENDIQRVYMGRQPVGWREINAEHENHVGSDGKECRKAEAIGAGDD